MINCATNQMRRVELLRESLEQSLKNCSKLNNSVSTYSSVISGVEVQLGGSAQSTQSTTNCQKRPLCLLFQTPVEAVIQIGGAPKQKLAESSRFTVSPTPNAVPVTTISNPLPPASTRASGTSSANKPLRVIVPVNGCQPAAVDSGFEQRIRAEESSKHGSSRSLPMLVNGTACSPASSVDSGFASPAAISHLDLMSQSPITTSSMNTTTTTTTFSLPKSSSLNFQATAHPNPRLAEEELQFGMKFRQRSASECFLEASRRLFTNRRTKEQQQLLGNGGQKIDGAAPSGNSTCCPQLPSPNGLKSILKKPAMTHHQMGGNHMRRNPTRFSLHRSTSECLTDDDEMTMAFNGMVLNKLCETSGQEECVMFEEEKEMDGKQGDRGSESSLNTEPVTTAGESSDEKQDNPPEKRKKRVSFSEHVQARIYRSNSSILGQKKKNDKKKLSKRRRSESENSNSESSCAETIPSSNASKVSSNSSVQSSERQEHVLVKSDKEIGIVKNCARRDSGIEDTAGEADEEDDVSLSHSSARPIFCTQANFPAQLSSPSKRVKRLVSADSAIGEEALLEEVEALS